MRPERKPPSVLHPERPAAPRAGRDGAGLSAQRERAERALAETRAAMQSGEIERTAGETLKHLEAALTGIPEGGGLSAIAARVVASGDRAAKLPPVPLAGIALRLKVENKVVREATTNVLGLAALEIDQRRETPYELEALTPDCQVLSCQAGTWKPDGSPPAHLFEVPRTDALKPHIERAKPFEDAIRGARARAALAREATGKALKAQEKGLVEYLASIDTALTHARERTDDNPPGSETTRREPQQPRRR